MTDVQDPDYPGDDYLEQLAERQMEMLSLPSSSWDEVDMEKVLSGGLDEEPPVFLCRTDGVPLLYRGKVSDIHGEPEACKGWIACVAAADVIARGEHVVYLDFEDSAKGVVSRMVSLGVSEDSLVKQFHYAGPEVAIDGTNELNLVRLLEAHSPLGLVVFDGVTQAISNQNLSSTDNDDIAKFFRVLPRDVSRRYEAAVLMVDHITKDAGNPRYAIGAQTKLGAIDGASFYAKITQPFGRGREGAVQLSVVKDRPGYVREFASASDSLRQHVTTVRLVSDQESGNVSVTLEVPEAPVSPEEKAFVLEQQILGLITTEPGLSKNKVVTAIPGGKRQAKWDAIDRLVKEGMIRVEDGPRKSVLCYPTSTSLL